MNGTKPRAAPTSVSTASTSLTRKRCFAGVVAVEPDTREDYGEKRWVGLGLIHGRITHVVFAERGPDTIRIISLRKATKHEREQYEKAIQDRLEEG